MSPTDSLPPFSFSLLSSSTSSTVENLEALDLLTKLSSPLPVPKPTITAPNEIEVEDMLEWVAYHEGAWKVMEKKIYASDVSDRLNRFMVSKHIVKEKIKPKMTLEEIAVTNILNSSERGQCVGEGQTCGRKRGREHEGLQVTVYDRSGRDYLLYLTRWDSSEESLLKGGTNYKEFHSRSYFATSDLVEMWAFRDGAGKLCFVIGKKLDLNLSL